MDDIMRVTARSAGRATAREAGELLRCECAPLELSHWKGKAEGENVLGSFLGSWAYDLLECVQRCDNFLKYPFLSTQMS